MGFAGAGCIVYRSPEGTSHRRIVLKPEQQENYWRQARYRGPTDPLVLAYALPKLDRIESALPLVNRSVLDVGCGPGLFTYHLAARAGRVVGTDISPSMLARAQGFETVQANAEALPFPDSSFDVAFEANLLHHASNPAKVVSEMARVAKEAVVVIEPNRSNPVMFAFSLLVAAERGGLRSSRSFLEHLLSAAGLSVRYFWTTGMISQNNTPRFLVPLLRLFDIDFPLGEYHVAIAAKVRQESRL
jgi:SAM-dependent methyltransferase